MRDGNNVRKRKDFTLLELLTVIGIIGVLISLIVINVGDAIGEADDLTCKNNLKAVADAYKAYEIAYGVPPVASNTNQLVKILQGDPKECSSDEDKNPKRTKFLDVKLFTKVTSDDGTTVTYDSSHHWDNWGNVVVLSGSQSAGFTLTSPGEDGVLSTKGDNVVVTWK